MVKVMIVDHHALVRVALETRLRSAAGIEILGSTGEYDQAPQQIRRLSPDVILLEIKAPGGFATLEQLRRIHPRGRVIVLTTYSDSREEDESLALGASRYLLKTLDTQNLLREIYTVASACPSACACTG
jgi:DNA-binding NarL/FixJ family response regulator